MADMDPLDVVRRHCEASEGVDMVPRIRELLDDWERMEPADRERLRAEDPAMSLVSSDVEVRVRTALESADGRGLEGVVRLYRGWYALWETYTYEIEAYRDLGGGATITTTHVHGSGRGGLPVDMTVFELRRVSEGLIVSWEIFDSEQAALRASSS
jgi:hypothetical protein